MSANVKHGMLWEWFIHFRMVLNLFLIYIKYKGGIGYFNSSDVFDFTNIIQTNFNDFFPLNTHKNNNTSFLSFPFSILYLCIKYILSFFLLFHFWQYIH